MSLLLPFIRPLFLLERKPGEDSGVFPEAGVGAAESGRVAGLVHPAVYPHPRTEPGLFAVLLPPVVRHLPGFTSQLPVSALPVHAYPLAESSAAKLQVCSFRDK